MIVISTHYSEIAGTSDQLAKYLHRSKMDMQYIEVSMPGQGLSPIIVSEKANVNSKRALQRLAGPIGDALVLSTFPALEKAECFIGVDPVSYTLGWASVKIRNPKCKTIFYSVDYSPRRFSNPLLNIIYKMMEEFALRSSENVWVVSEKMVRLRGDQIIGSDKVIHVPNGSWMRTDSIDISRKEGPIQFVFAGNLKSGSGIADFIKSSKKSEMKFNIIGTGKLENEIRNVGKDQVKMYGTIPNDDVLELYSKKKWIGIAPYDRKVETFLEYGFSLKIVEYLSCGLPVVAPSFVEPAQHVRLKGAGFIYDDINEIPSIVDDIKSMSNDRYLEMSHKALELGSEYFWSNIYDRAFARSNQADLPKN